MIPSLISQKPFIPHLFEALDPLDQMMLDKTEYEQYVHWFNQCTDARFERIMYWSEGLRITGILSSPKTSEPSQRTPVIIYNRGGVGEIGKITVRTLYKRIYPLVQQGYTVIASQYRGNDGSEGKDEVGGSDIQDVISLLPVIQSLPTVDSENLFMVGFSRGAINTYRVLQKKVLPIKACAVLSGLSDLFSLEQLRPDMIPLLEQYVPNYHTNRTEELTKRSALYWAKDLSVPLLLVHGGKDDMVSVATTKRLEEALTQHHRACKLVVCSETDHSLDGYEDLITNEIHTWFMEHSEE